MFEKKNRKLQLKFRHVFLVALTFIIALAASMFVYASQVKEIQVNNKGKIVNVKTMGKTVRDVIKEGNIELDSNDIVSPGLETEIEKVNLITIEKKEQNVPQTDTNKNITINNNTQTVKSDQKSNESGKEVKSDTYLKETVVVKNKIPYKTIKKKNSKLRKGVTKVVREGKTGVTEKKYEVTYKDGKKISCKVISKNVVKKPVDKVIEYGTANLVTTSRGSELRYRECITMRATAYDASYESTGKRPGHPDYGMTAMGVRVRPGIVAVDPDVIPLGSRLYIESLQEGVPDYGRALAADTGGAIKGNKIDLFFETSREVDDWGVRKVKVYVLE